MWGEVKDQEGHAARVSLECWDGLWVVLPQIEDMAVDPAKITLHDTGHDEQVGGVQRGFHPCEGHCGESLTSHSGGDTPETVAFDHVGAPPRVCVVEDLDVGRLQNTCLGVGPADKGWVGEEYPSNIKETTPQI
jgi:hypothetical protein